MERGAHLRSRKRAGWEASEESTVLRVQSLPALTKDGKNNITFVRHHFAVVFMIGALEKRKEPRLTASCFYLLLRSLAAVC